MNWAFIIGTWLGSALGALLFIYKIRKTMGE